MRLIDANALREEFKQGVYVVDGMCNVYQILHNIDTAPTIDAEPVVRCKDCRHRNKECRAGYCRMLGKFTEDTFYCQYGAKKDEE